jgi:hypothetical protein
MSAFSERCSAKNMVNQNRRHATEHSDAAMEVHSQKYQPFPRTLTCKLGDYGSIVSQR